jgi:hypothetical protein
VVAGEVREVQEQMQYQHLLLVQAAAAYNILLAELLDIMQAAVAGVHKLAAQAVLVD